MKRIKKVAVSPLPVNEAKVIDSFSTTDDKTINAPSINAVENYTYNKSSVYTKTEANNLLNTKVSNTSDNYTYMTFSQTGFCHIVRRGNTVSICLEAYPQDNRNYTANSLTLPNWARASSDLTLNSYNTWVVYDSNNSGAWAKITLSDTGLGYSIYNINHTDTEFMNTITYVAD